MFHTDTYTIKQLKPFSLGFNDFFDFAERYPLGFEEPKFPKYNILKPTDTTYAIEMALAGYSKDDLDIEHKDGVLTISHQKPEGTEKSVYLHQGITKKSFSKSFALAETVIVVGAIFHNGLLTINLEEIIPEEKKPKKISILEAVTISPTLKNNK